MSFLGLIYLTFYDIFFVTFAFNHSDPSSFKGSELYYDNVGYTVFTKYTNVMNEVYNIFAWIDVFIDLDLIFGLLFLTLLFYGLKFASALARRVLGCFK